ncbi:hypothetical protein N7532_001514 [Penicillium argentinense]|uniref:Uncharacterized protein n=1 Tax=Penicillium argentinense TaxID=1131581 RepID=A0A9W9G2L7_9EURO|nr:uncharacterized protein N7532_001514 [Penicillium argentinense]KAJ5110979.1 hypothetical protein N7532_001514 [Penicillium argentinense]
MPVKNNGELAPATLQNYEKNAKNWILWRLSRGEASDPNFHKDQPIPTPQVLKSFVEYYVVTREKIPTQSSTCQNFIKFTSPWERKTSCSISKEVKDDVLNHLTFNIMRSSRDEGLKRWVTISPEDGAIMTRKICEFLGLYSFKKNLVNSNIEHPALGMSFVFWVIVHGVADGAFKGLTTMAEVLSIMPPKWRESLTLEWNENKKELPFLRMINHDGP